MKKSLLTLGAAAIALTGMAASPMQMTPASALKLDRNQQIQPLGNLRVGNTPASMMKAPAKINSSDDVITTPSLPKQSVDITGSGYYLFLGIMLASYENETVASHICYGADNEVYFYDILPNAGADSYVKGVQDGDKIVIDLPQTVLYDDENGDGYNLTMLKYTEYEEDGEVYATYVPDEEKTSVVLNIDENGTMVADIAEDGLLGLAMCSDGSWGGYGAWELSINLFTQEAVTLPADYEAVPDFWTMITDGFGWKVTWSQGSDDVYFQGLGDSMPEAWMKGSLEVLDETQAVIRIAQDQYLGEYSGFRIFSKAAKLVWEDGNLVDGALMPEDYEYEMIWDFEKMTITPKDPEVSLLLNAATDRIYYLQILGDYKMILQDGLADGTPADPYNLSFDDTLDYYGYSGFFFTIPALNTEGEMMDTEKLYYVVYVDGELWEFTPEEYETEETITEVPWNLGLYYIWKTSTSGREVDFFVEGLDEAILGVQSVYKNGDEETRSNIVELDVAQSKVVAVGDKKVASVKYYGLDGREVANPAEGIYIQRMTFEDGTSATLKKVIR